MLAMIPDIKRQEEASDTILGRVTVLESDLNNYREQLAEVKHEYTSRLSLVSSILQGGPLGRVREGWRNKYDTILCEYLCSNTMLK